MPKFQSTVNPKEIIEVSEERAAIFRSKVQTGWQEYFEAPQQKEEENTPVIKKAGRPKRVQ